MLISKTHVEPSALAAGFSFFVKKGMPQLLGSANDKKHLVDASELAVGPYGGQKGPTPGYTTKLGRYQA